MGTYQLVDCSFHDELEALATLQQQCKIIYQADNNEVVEINNQIIDVYAVNRAEFLKLEDGSEIRLDRLISVNGKSIQFSC